MFMDIGGCRLLDGDGDGGGLVADLHVHLGGAGLDAVDGAVPETATAAPSSRQRRTGWRPGCRSRRARRGCLSGWTVCRPRRPYPDADGGVVRDRAVLVHLTRVLVSSMIGEMD